MSRRSDDPFEPGLSPEAVTNRAWRRAKRLWDAGNFRAALTLYEMALEADPHCREILIAVGDLYRLEGEALGLSEAEAASRSLRYYQRAIDAHPEHAEAYAEMTASLLLLQRWQEALECADLGFALFDRWPTTDEPPGVHTNIGESLHARKAEALVRLGRAAEGRTLLFAGLERYPASDYLTHHTHLFLPDLDATN